MLKPNSISYYVGEDLAEQKGDIFLDGNCSVEVRNSCLMKSLQLIGQKTKG